MIILFLAYLVLAQSYQTDNLVTGRIVVSTQGASASWQPSSNTAIEVGALIPTDFIPLPKGKCEVVVASSIWVGMTGLSQSITLAEAKNTTSSRNIQVCTLNSGYGAILCDGKIKLDDEYYLMRIDFNNTIPYFTINYQCRIA